MAPVTGGVGPQHVTPRRRIRDVWAWNFDAEFDDFLVVVGRCSSVVLALDIEFPGCLCEDPLFAVRAVRYWALQENVDLLQPIQLGLAVADGDDRALRGAWNFNIWFDLTQSLYTEASVRFLQAAGVNFPRHAIEGIDPRVLAWRLLSSPLVGQHDNSPRWVTFSGWYDWGYLLKLLTCGGPMPGNLGLFDDLLAAHCPFRHELRDRLPRGSLDSLIAAHGIERVGAAHTAGSDALATLELYLLESTLEGDCAKPVAAGAPSAAAGLPALQPKARAEPEGPRHAEHSASRLSARAAPFVAGVPVAATMRGAGIPGAAPTAPTAALALGGGSRPAERGAEWEESSAGAVRGEQERGQLKPASDCGTGGADACPDSSKDTESGNECDGSDTEGSSSTCVLATPDVAAGVEEHAARLESAGRGTGPGGGAPGCCGGGAHGGAAARSLAQQPPARGGRPDATWLSARGGARRCAQLRPPGGAQRGEQAGAQASAHGGADIGGINAVVERGEAAAAWGAADSAAESAGAASAAEEGETKERAPPSCFVQIVAIWPLLALLLELAVQTLRFVFLGVALEPPCDRRSEPPWLNACRRRYSLLFMGLADVVRSLEMQLLVGGLAALSAAVFSCCYFLF